MKRFLYLILIFMVAFSSLMLSGCKTGKYEPKLEKDFYANGFAIKTTSDFNLISTTEGIKLNSIGDDKVSFSNATIVGGYDCGSVGYSFSDTSLADYVKDIFKIENLILNTPVRSLTVKQKNGDAVNDFTLQMYVVDEMQNESGNWDFYTILCIGKCDTAFVNFKVTTSIQDDFYDENIEKYAAIIGSLEFTQPDLTHDSSIESYISSTMVMSDNVMGYYKFNFSIPNDFIAYEIPDYVSGNHLATSYALEEFWSATIRCSNLASFMGNAVLDDEGAKHLIKFSTNNYLGFYIKSSSSENSASYKIYYLNGENKLNIYYTKIDVSCSQELNEKGFINYFESQMAVWMKDTQILP